MKWSNHAYMSESYGKRASPTSRSPIIVCSVARVYWQCSTGAMIMYCSLATSPLACCLTQLYAAMFGDTDTSYQLMNHRPGLSIGMLSFHRPPLYHAGSLGARTI